MSNCEFKMADLEKPDMTGEEIVVTGMSGMFPESGSVQKFMDNLYNKVDMVSKESRWNLCNPEIPQYFGTVDGVEQFDAQFFKVSYQKAITMEPVSRKTLEHAYGAIFDSGNTHVTLKGKIVGVFMGSSYSDFTSFSMFDMTKATDSIISGTSKSMMANLISYWMDGKGPSYCVDYSCVSTAAALEQAYNFMKNGNCDAAVVGGGNLCSYPALSSNLKKTGMLCLDGRTKCFDENGDGFARSESINVIFLQKAKDAKRVYAELVHVEGAYQLKANDRFLPVRKSEELQKFFNEVYSKTEVDPKDVEYVEASAVAIAEADRNEAEAIGNVFYDNKAVKVGSVKSNMGHSEPASGLCSLTKLCLAYHKGELPANLHLEEPVKAVKEGKVHVLTENTKFDRGYTAINNFSYTGAGYHIILKGHYKKKNLLKYQCSIPRLVCASGRQDGSLKLIFDELKSKMIDAEEIALLHNIFESDIVGHTGRGFTILDTVEDGTMAITENVDHFSGTKPPLWFVFSGMGSQWVGMGRDLMRIPIFSSAIERCQKALEPKGIDLLEIITGSDNNILDSVVNSFVGIGAVQIGLTNILKEMGVEPDFTVGHSLGETACAYHDNTLTVEQTILSMYSRAMATHGVKLIKGAMAAVGMGYKTLVKECPPEIDIACRNSAESSTISGPADVVKEFIEDLKKRGIFARMVHSSNIAFHSRYIHSVGPVLLESIKDLLKDPKPRSQKWISTSVPKEKWDDPDAKYSSAEYLKNNMLNPVLFEDALRLIPDNAVVVEIAPHGLLQAILKRSLKNCTHIPLTKRGSPDGVKFLLEAIGKLYTCGFNPKIEVLYPKVEFPVSTETPLLSHLVGWEHSETWPKVSFRQGTKITSPSRNIVFSPQDEDYKYLDGYLRNGVNVVPEAALLAFVWETLAMYQGTDFRNFSVMFKDIQFHSEVVVLPEKLVRLNIMISKGNNIFEVTHDNKLVITGSVIEANPLKITQARSNLNSEPADEFEPEVNLSDQDIYKILRMRGYAYSDTFRSITSANMNRTKALIKWTDNWIPFLDSLIQLNTVSRDYNGISKPKFIRVLKICIEEQKRRHYETIHGFKCYDASVDSVYGKTSCAGVQIEDITYTNAPMAENKADVMESKTFFPYYPTEEVNVNTAIEMSLQVVSENSGLKNVLITKVVTSTASKEFDVIDEVVNKANMFNVEIKTIKELNKESIYDINNETRLNVILMKNLLQDSKKLSELQNIPDESFILSIEENVPKIQSVKDVFSILSSMSDGKKIFILMKKIKTTSNEDTCFIPIKFDDTFSWVPDVYSKLVTTKRVVLVSERQPYCGDIGFVKNLKTSGQNVSVVIIDDFNAPKFDPNNDFYKYQLQQNLTVNIMKKGQWGSFYYKSAKKTQKLKSFALKNLNPGTLDNIVWVEAPKISGDKELAQVCYLGLSINNCNKMMDDAKNKNESTLLGMDFSGIDKNGDKIMGLTSGGSAASTIEVDPDLVWSVPDHWSLDDAATVPLAYVQAYYCLIVRRELRRDETVLICDGTNSVGLAAISICLSYNCTVFTVVDTEEKKKYLLQCYPEIGENNIICSDDDNFFHILMSMQKEPTFSSVLSFFSGPLRQAAMKCVGDCGFFFDFSKHDVYNNESFGMSYLCRERSYQSINVSNIFRPEYTDDRKILQKCIAQGIENGEVKPLKRMVYSPVQVTKAFEVLSQNKHIGKVLIKVRDPNIDGLETIPRLSYSPHDVIIIVCDERGIGVELADKLVERGARKIVLHMKSVSGYVQTKLLTWNKQKVSVKLSSDNLQTEKGSSSFMKNAIKFGKVKAVFIVFDPKHTDNGIKEDFISVFKKQSVVFMNLDVASRSCGDLRQFTVISRLPQNPSEEYSHSLIERMCDARNEIGLKTLVLHYKSVDEMDDKPTDNEKPQQLTSLFSAIEASIKLNYTNVLTYNIENTTEITSKVSEKDGLNALYELVDTEDYNMEAQPIVELPTLFNSGNCDTYLDHQNDAYIILMPGFNGRSQIFESAAERLKLRALSVQLGPDFEGKCIEDIALNIREEIKQKTKVINEKEDPDCDDPNIKDQRRIIRERRNERFYIMGYSFGVNLAMELAALLEKEGKTGVVHCLDSSPDKLRATIDNLLGQGSEDQLQNLILNHMSNLLTGEKNTEHTLNLENKTFKEKLDECLKQMKGVVNYSEQYKKLVLESAYKRIIMARQYKPEFVLRSQVVLMKNSKTDLDDYGLEKYTKNPVKVFPLHAHYSTTAPNDIRVSNIINMYLDEDDVNDFKNKNLCDVYSTRTEYC